MASRTDTPKCNRINSICLTNKTHATKKWDAAPLSIQAASAQDTDFNFEQDQEIDVVVVQRALIQLQLHLSLAAIPTLYNEYKFKFFANYNSTYFLFSLEQNL
jgi:hypothetical protein